MESSRAVRLESGQGPKDPQHHALNQIVRVVGASSAQRQAAVRVAPEGTAGALDELRSGFRLAPPGAVDQLVADAIRIEPPVAFRRMH